MASGFSAIEGDDGGWWWGVGVATMVVILLIEARVDGNTARCGIGSTCCCSRGGILRTYVRRQGQLETRHKPAGLLMGPRKGDALEDDQDAAIVRLFLDAGMRAGDLIYPDLAMIAVASSSLSNLFTTLPRLSRVTTVNPFRSVVAAVDLGDPVEDPPARL